MTSLARLQLCNDAKRLHYILGANSFGGFFFSGGVKQSIQWKKEHDSRDQNEVAPRNHSLFYSIK